LSSLLNRACAVLIGSLLICACQPELKSDLPAGLAAYDAIADVPASSPVGYALQPGDRIAVSMYQEDELNQRELLIDEAGKISLPLVGDVSAAGLTTGQLSRDIEAAYRRGFLRNPQANVLLLTARPRTVSVEGQVKDAGVYQIEPGYTLLSALALAGSTTDEAKLDEVLVFRTVNGQRMGGRFDLTEVRAGRMTDPQLIAGDVVVVGFSRSRGLYQDLLQVAPSLLGTFVTLADNNNN